MFAASYSLFRQGTMYRKGYFPHLTNVCRQGETP